MNESEQIQNSMKNMNISPKFSVKIDQSWIPANYNEVVDESILKISFKPDIFQKQSFYFLSSNQSIFVSAHTSSGKTLVAEYAIFLAQKNQTRVIYTSPIKALSNQKFYDFKNKFESVGLITGDIQVNPEAQCIIMTTEILRNLVYKNSDLLNDTEFIIFDEVHYINDPDRGVVWEESIIMAPKHINLVMLSATIPNSLEFADWVGRTRNKCVYVISTNTRAVPLEFVVYCDSEVFSVDPIMNEKTAKLSNFKQPLTPFSKKTKMVNRFRIMDLGNFINNRKLTPAIFFSFSKRTCEEYGKSLQLLDLTNPSEKSKIIGFLDDAMSYLREEDKYLPQIKAMKDFAYRGIAVHHGSLLPFVKECIEILFSRNLIKILIATETFAMGVNMPAKCCVFTSITKINNGVFRNLSASEFIQMSGRAGRRGMDKIGSVIIADQRMPSLGDIKKLISGIPYDLNSQFKLSFSLILMAVRSNIEVEELMRNSFKEHGIQKNMAKDTFKLRDLKTELSNLKKNSDNFEIIEFIDLLHEICIENKFFLKKSLKPGDIVVTRENSIYKIINIEGNKAKTESVDLILKGKFFSQMSKNLENFITDENLPQFSPSVLIKKDKEEIDIGSALFLIKHEQISFDYQFANIDYVLKINQLKTKFNMLETSKCINSPDFIVNYKESYNQRSLLNQIKSLEKLYSVENLELMEEYCNRIKFLESNGFIEQSITLKGRAAAEIRTVNEVLVVKLIFENKFKDFTPSELMAIFSTMINEEEEKGDEFEIYEELKDKMKILEEYHQYLSIELDKFNVPPFKPFKYSMVNAVFDWANNSTLGAIAIKHLIAEGAFVRLILRLEECCKEMINVCSLIGDVELEEKFKNASTNLKRDIVFLPSLYIQSS